MKIRKTPRKGGKRSPSLFFLQTIVLEGSDLKNLCNPYRTKTILHQVNKVVGSKPKEEPEKIKETIL